MKIIVIGASGTIGRAVVSELQTRHEIIKAGFTSGDVRVDIRDKNSIEDMFKKIDRVDGVVLTTGKVHFDDFMEMQEQEYMVGLQDKLMGQVNTVLIGRKYLKEGGSFTLTSGILSEDPIRYGSSASMVNGALNSFVIAAAIEMPKGQRINCVSPTVITEAMDNYGDYFRGFVSVSAARVALAYSKSVEGLQTGKIYRVL
ncbi:short chain dehydrogenase [Legionella micdadei]|uniref:NAD(P)-dependent dehydrogenase, short-chain alcohol dehydrogenase family n=1 Tax=Legionella micdadei TaxID=451 RepID=A0A098GF16_LEGMI|nr:short chain dehydrogenase [Legionella micdadei]ARG97834.1 short chain dehydrogenase [Legionella micdadei]ARG99848.1 short chain dehydrogenase [Legionella micdadei]KTD28547.1 short chain dehydrogenase [Legionella micdadei]NSL19140.1 short chain dehydrogenase [Legionella micdadei]CEG60560.1 Short chain dehydrogenase [Legionella micdadei]